MPQIDQRQHHSWNIASQDQCRGPHVQLKSKFGSELSVAQSPELILRMIWVSIQNQYTRTILAARLVQSCKRNSAQASEAIHAPGQPPGWSTQPQGTKNPGSMNLRAPWGSDQFHVHIGSPRVLTRGEVGTGGDWPRLRVPRPDSTFSPNQSQAQNWKIVRKAFQNTGPWGLEPGSAPHLPGLRTVLPVVYLLFTVEVEKVI